MAATHQLGVAEREGGFYAGDAVGTVGLVFGCVWRVVSADDFGGAVLQCADERLYVVVSPEGRRHPIVLGLLCVVEDVVRTDLAGYGQPFALGFAYRLDG